MRHRHILKSRVYQRSIKEKEYATYQAIRRIERNIVRYIERHSNAISATSREMLILELACDQSVTWGVSLRARGIIPFLELIEQALSALVNNADLILYQDEVSTAIGLPNTPMRSAVREAGANVPISNADDPLFDWAILGGAKYSAEVTSELAAY